MATVEAHILGDVQQSADTPVGASVWGAIEKSYNDVKPSAQLPESTWDYEKTGAKEPPSPYDFNELSAYLETSTWLYRCVKAIAISTVGLGYDLVVAPGVKKDEADPEHKKVLEEFFKHPNDEMTWGEIIECLLVDFATVGNAYLEIRRDKKGWGSPAAVEHVQAASVRVRKDKNGFIQLRDTRKSYYRKFGNPPSRKELEEGDKPEYEFHFHPEDKGKLQKDRRILNELFHFKNYHPRSSYYGLPDFLPAMRAILGNIKVADHNNVFFDNNAVPQYMFIIRGGEVGDDTYKNMAKFFEQEVKGSAHRTLVIHIRREEGESVDVDVKPLATEIKDASFRMYRADNAEEIRIAYGVPGRLVGLTEKGGLGGAGEGTAQQEIFKYHVIEPLRRRIEHRINDFLIKQGFGFQDWEYRFRDVDITDTGKRADYINKLVRLGVMTINEAREKMNLDPLDTTVYPLAGMPVIRDSAGGLMDLRRWPDLQPQNVEPSKADDPGHDALLRALEPGADLIKSLALLHKVMGKVIAGRKAA